MLVDFGISTDLKISPYFHRITLDRHGEPSRASMLTARPGTPAAVPSFPIRG
jgi:hypothetical protein